MQWREIGPFRGGRGVAIEGVPGEPNTYYFGAVAGGIWKTTEAAPTGSRCSTSSTRLRRSAPRGRAERSQHDLAGSGESALRGNITYGDGVYKSVDGGRNWRMSD